MMIGNMRDLQDNIFQTAVKEKQRIWLSFWFVYIAILALLVWGSTTILFNFPSMTLAYTIGVWSGRAALTILAIVLVPGILGRFAVQIKVTRIITFYRRQLGITTFLLAFTHGMLVRTVARFAHGWYPADIAPVFELFGSLALSLLFLLFVTSNDASVKRLGFWWKRLHRLVYIIVWLVLFHTLLQRVSVWSVMIGSVAVLEVVSLVYAQIRRLTSS